MGEKSKTGKFVIQWHINEVCNLACLHCYQEGTPEGNISRERFLNVAQQIVSFRPEVSLHVNLTGGEPFLHDQLLDIVSYLKNHRDMTIGILSNGTMISKTLADNLVKTGVSFVQISLDGGKGVHDKIRGKGSFQKAVHGIRILKKSGIKVHISFTANRWNLDEFPRVAKLGRKLGVDRVWSDRIIPEGTAENHSLELNQEETKKYIMMVGKENTKKGWFFRKNPVAASRALQFLPGSGQVYSCTAGQSLLAIMPDGDVYPCRRLPLKIGNAFEMPLAEIYADNIFLKMKDAAGIPEGCETCYYLKACRGGLVCLSYATFGTVNKKDPGCWVGQETGQP